MIPLLDKAPNSKKRWIKAIFSLLALQNPADTTLPNSSMTTSYESIPLSESVEPECFSCKHHS